MPGLSLSFKLCCFFIWTLVSAVGGAYLTYEHYDAKEAKRAVAVVKVKELVRVKDEVQLKRARAKLVQLDQLNINLEEELKRARTQNIGTCTYGPAAVELWDAKLVGRPVGVPSPASGLSAQGQGARDATIDDLQANHAINAAEWARDREKLAGLREWACRVHKVGCD
jgi:hypothetical protein